MMKFKTYKGTKVTVERVFMIGDKQFVDLRDPRNGHEFRSVPVTEFEKGAEAKEVVFEKDGHKQTFVKNSAGYKTFIKDNKLNPLFIDNCLKGISKTHKGFKIYCQNF